MKQTVQTVRIFRKCALHHFEPAEPYEGEGSTHKRTTTRLFGRLGEVARLQSKSKGLFLQA